MRTSIAFKFMKAFFFVKQDCFRSFYGL